MELNDMSGSIKTTKQQTDSNPLEHVVSWDLERMIEAVNSPSVTVPSNIKSYGGFSKWVKSLLDEDFK